MKSVTVFMLILHVFTLKCVNGQTRAQFFSQGKINMFLEVS